jgi:hypothetical protein
VFHETQLPHGLLLQSKTAPEDGTGLSRVAIVILEHAAESLATLHSARFVFNLFDRFDQLILESLMIPLGVIVCHVLFECPTQLSLTKEYHLLQALGF